jgi:AAA15 family ATPase/GTPase
MLTNIHIQNFKSVRDLKFDAKRVNLFIGEPNTGKTNVLEALALLSEGVHGPTEFKEVFRFRSVADLFTDQQVANPISVVTSGCRCTLSFDGQLFEFNAKGTREGDQEQRYSLHQNGQPASWVNLQYGIIYYRFKPGATTTTQAIGLFQPPFGVNLTSILQTNKGLRGRVNDLFRSRNFRLEMRPVENEFRIAKMIDDELFSFPYDSVSETWRRIVFYMAVLETNQKSTILLDEPEANTFPFYTSYLAERIALDESNQFFMTTHNPYILSSIVGKTPVKDLAVFVVHMENFCTTLRPVSVDGLSKILDYGPDAFLNLDKVVEG